MKKIIYVLLFIALYSCSSSPQQIREIDKVVLIYYQNRPNNLIIIPNTGKLPKFKIYRKLKSETEFRLVAIKNRPPLPMRYNVTQYGVSWVDKEFNTQDVDYKIIACNSNDETICEMDIIWQDNQ
jgi:hypothetical protein